ncbi:MAG: SCO family protein [Flavobacteriales bacterium]|nr:SCO family protein [Flavobacteriales bacterium]
MAAIPPYSPTARRKKIAILGGIALFVLSLFVFFSPLLGLVKHTFNYLPYYGPKETLVVQRDGKPIVDTIYAEIHFPTHRPLRPAVHGKGRGGQDHHCGFLLHTLHHHLPQDERSDAATQLKLNDEAYKDVVFLSHTVDPEYDTPAVLNEHAEKIGGR